MIRKIWNSYNVSLVLILPIFNDIFDNIFYQGKKIKYPFNQLCFEYGLENTFLYRNGKFNNSLWLKFDKHKISKNRSLTTSKYGSLIELIVDNSCYKSLDMNSDHVYIELEIPENYIKDIKIIIESKYSTVSNEYKQALKIKQQYVPISDNEVGRYLCIKNLAYSICSKTEIIKKEIEKQIKIKLQGELEYYEKFNEKKENW